MRRLARRLPLAVAPPALAYLLLEFVFSPMAWLPLPHRLQWNILTPLMTFSQPTRSRRVPRDYIAIVGDSYAVGIVGEASFPCLWTPRGCASDALLFERTGRDTLSIGHAGAGSLVGLVGKPVSTYEFFGRTLLYKLPEPGTLLAYFYEGNDLDDNLRELLLRHDGTRDEARLRDPAYFREFIESTVLRQHPLHRRAVGMRLRDQLLFLELCRALLGKSREWLGGKLWSRLAAPPPTPATARANRVRISGREVAVPDSLQAPSLELGAAELRRSVYVFEQALGYLSSYFPRTRVFVVYIPSVASCYDWASRRVSVEQYWGRGGAYDPGTVGARSDLIAGLIRDASERAGATFIDARPTLRAAARHGLIHGPAEWTHLNRSGYAALVEAILPAL